MEKGEVKLSPAMSEIVKAVQQSKWTLMRTRQQLSRGYKEVMIFYIKLYINYVIFKISHDRFPTFRPTTTFKSKHNY